MGCKCKRKYYKGKYHCKTCCKKKYYKKKCYYKPYYKTHCYDHYKHDRHHRYHDSSASSMYDSSSYSYMYG